MISSYGRFYDTLNFFAKLRPLRVWNVLQVVSSFYVSRWLRRAIQWGRPFSISIEPTTACNLRCPECPSGLRTFTRPTGNLRVDFFRQTIDQLADRLLYLIFYFQGEPYIHPRFLDMVCYANQRGLYTITSTNGHFLTDENARQTVLSGLDRLIISVDGSTQETYEQYRREGRLEEVLAGTRRVVAWKNQLQSRTPYIVFQMLVVRPNEHQTDEVAALARSIGVDEVKYKTAQVYDYVNGNPLIPTQARFARYAEGDNGKWYLKNPLLNHCWKLWHSCVITWNGSVVPCCFDKDAAHALGNLRTQNFATIWQSDAYQSFRSQLLRGRDQIDICTNCTEGCKVWA